MCHFSPDTYTTPELSEAEKKYESFFEDKVIPLIHYERKPNSTICKKFTKNTTLESSDWDWECECKGMAWNGTVWKDPEAPADPKAPASSPTIYLKEIGEESLNALKVKVGHLDKLSFVKKMNKFEKFNKIKIPLRDWYPKVKENAKNHTTTDFLQKEYYDKDHPKLGNRWKASQWIGGTTVEAVEDLYYKEGFRWNTMHPEQSAEQSARGYVLQLFKAAGAFHCLGFAHYDMHLGNVKIADDGQLVLIDFDRMTSITFYYKTDLHSMTTLFEVFLKFGGIDGEYEKCLMEHLQQLLELEKGLPRYCILFDSQQGITEDNIFQANSCSQKKDE
jgi:serine/threonine protein kinase